MNKINSIHRSVRVLSELGEVAPQKTKPAKPQQTDAEQKTEWNNAREGIICTIKFRVGTFDEATSRLYVKEDLATKLHDLLDRTDAYRQVLLNDKLQPIWDENPAQIRALAYASKKKPYQQEESCFAWMQTTFVTAVDKSQRRLDSGLERAVVNGLVGNVKSTVGLRSGSGRPIYKAVRQNQNDWDKKIIPAAKKVPNFPVDDAPPKIDTKDLREPAIESYNAWVSRAKLAINLLLRQKAKLEAKDAPFPARLKGYPSFPGSRLAEKQQLGTNRLVKPALAALEEFALEQATNANVRFSRLTDEQWKQVCENFSVPEKIKMANKPKTIRRIHSIRLMALIKASGNPNASELKEIALKLLDGILRKDPNYPGNKDKKDRRPGAAQILKHHIERIYENGHSGYTDRQAVIKLAHLYNFVSAFALYPLFASGETALFLELETKRKNLFGNFRGVLAQPKEAKDSLKISGFSLNKSGTAQYRALLAYQELPPKKAGYEPRQKWALLYSLHGQYARALQTEKQIKTAQQKLEKARAAGKVENVEEESGWFSFGKKRIGSKRSKVFVLSSHHPVWWPTKKEERPLVLPLNTGDFNARKFFNHYDYNLRRPDGWILGSPEIMRETPLRYDHATDAWVEDRSQTKFFVTVSMSRKVVLRELKNHTRIVGADLGEAVPAAYALTDAEGRSCCDSSRVQLLNQQVAEWAENNLEKRKPDREPTPAENWQFEPTDGFGFSEPGFSEHLREHNKKKQKAQQTHGGYSGALRRKEGNIGRWTVGRVIRDLLHQLAANQAVLALERLDAALSHRGGKKSLMTVHQYQNILKTISHKLAEAGHYDLSADEMNSEQNSKNGSESAVAENGLLKLVDAKFTSRTCSACGCVHESDCEPLYEKLLPELRCVDGRWQVTCPNGAILKLPREVFYLWMGKEKHIVTDDELRPLEEKIKTNSLSKTKKADLFRLLRNHLLQFRPAQSVFRCLNCGHVTQADFQAALNTARRWLYYTETTDKDWQAWYQQKLATVWHK